MDSFLTLLIFKMKFKKYVYVCGYIPALTSSVKDRLNGADDRQCLIHGEWGSNSYIFTCTRVESSKKVILYLA